MVQKKHDIVVIGAGMVGLCIARLLSDLPLSIAIVEAHEIPDWDNDSYSSRVSALSPASQQILDKAGIWSVLKESRISPYDTMRVWEQGVDSPESLLFSAQEIGIDSLGWIVENNLVRSCLKKTFDTQPGKARIKFYIPDRLDNISVTESSALLNLQSGQQLSAKLIIAADGANSITRRKLNLSEVSRSYQQYAVVAQLKTGLPHQSTAYQRFHGQEVLGILPLANEQCSIVWSCSQDKAESLLKLSSEAFAEAVTEFSQGVLGEFELVGTAKAFPLQLLHSRQYVTERVVLCGDAAHAVHPFAGQGVNLGFLDAAVLTQVITRAWLNNFDLGDLSMLREYERERKSSNVQMMTGLDTLFALFQSYNPVLQQARRVGMGLVNQISPIKNIFIQQALGLKKL